MQFWNIFLIGTIIFLIYCFFYFKYLGGFSEIFWKISYLIFSWCLVFIYFFLESDLLLKTFFQKIDDSIIVKDLQDLVNLSVDLSYILSLYFITPLIIFYCLSYFIGFWKKNILLSWKYCFFLGIYFLFIFKFFLDTDLFLSGWNFFNKKITYGFDFQPDLVYIIIAYIGDYYDFAFFFFYLFAFYCLLNKLHLNLSAPFRLKNLFYSKFIFFVINSLFMFYFFGGESLFRDFFIFLFIFLSIEFYCFTYLFLFHIKRKKI